jgi:hypothetical protein
MGGRSVNSQPDPVTPAARVDADAALFTLLDGHWESLRRGANPEPLPAAPGPDEPPELRVLAALHGVRELLAEEARPPAAVGTAQGPSLPAGTRLGECRVEGLLGCGGMGEVYLAEHEVLKRRVAVKVLPAHLAGAADAVDRFRTSVQLLARLNPHPHVAAALHASEHQGRLFLVQEYVPGLTLQDQVRYCGRLPVGEACALVRQAAAGLDYAHRHGIVHRDIKPANLIRTPDGTLKILDLGLAHLAGHPSPPGAAGPDDGCLVGTVDYMAPEQARDAPRADARSDLYSLGCTFYYLLTGHPPFPAGTVAEKLRAHARATPPDVRQPRPDVPPAVAAVLRKLLAKQPADRYPCARAVGEALAAATELPRHRLGVRAGTGVLILVTLGLLGLAPFRFGPRSPEADCPSLERLELYVERQRDPSEFRTLVAGGAERDLGPLAPLGPGDGLRLEGHFRQPTYWYLLWFDTAGVLTVEARAAVEQTAVEFPAGNLVATVDPVNPAGVHLLLLVAGRVPPETAPGGIQERLGRVGKPPCVLPAAHARLLRGAGDPVAPSATLPSAYLSEIQARMPEGLRAVHGLFFRTVK